MVAPFLNSVQIHSIFFFPKKYSPLLFSVDNPCHFRLFLLADTGRFCLVIVDCKPRAAFYTGVNSVLRNIMRAKWALAPSEMSH